MTLMRRQASEKDLEALRWEVRALEYRLAQRPEDLPPVSSRWDYFLSLLASRVPLPYAIRLERDETLLLQKHEHVAGIVAAQNADRDAAKASAEALDSVFLALSADEVALEEFEREAQERALKLSKFNRDFFAEHKRLPDSILRPIRNEMLRERGLVLEKAGLLSPALEMVTFKRSENNSKRSENGCSEAA